MVKPPEATPDTGTALLIRPFQRFFRLEAASGILLLVCAVAALAWANSPVADSYTRVWSTRITIGAAGVGIAKPLLLWINDGLMAVFFLVVGLEIKREVLVGELAAPRKAALPIAAAIGGMLVPAGVYALLNSGGAGARGWGIPMATDIAFALGVIALLGSRVPAVLKVFVTAVAIVDDLGAVIVIALFYTARLSPVALATAGGLLVVLVLLNRFGVRRLLPYLVVGLALWVAVLKSGMHATIAGVLLALTIPAADPLQRLEHGLHPWIAFLVIPVFALANAGVTLGADIGATLTSPIAIGILLGLFIGKQAGIVAFASAAARAGLADLPTGVTWRQIWGVSLLCGIGFTMSLFIASLAFADPGALDQAKVGILTGSLASGLAGALVLGRGARAA